MINICQWRTSIGLWYFHHIPSTTKKTPSTTDIPEWIKSLLMSRDEGGGTSIFFLVLFLLLLLILSGDIELNPGPKTELTSNNALQFLVKSGFVVEDKWTKLTSFLGVSLEERRRLKKMVSIDQDYHFALEEGLQWWITNGSAPCWEELISAVESCGDKGIATTLRRQLDIKDEGLSEGQKEEMIGQDRGQTLSSCDKSIYSDSGSTSTTESDEVNKVLKSVLTSHFVDLSEQLSRCLPQVSAAMYFKRLISESVRDSPTVYNVIDEFESGMRLASNISKLQEHCQLFLQCLSSEGGPTKLEAQKLCQDWIEEVKKQCDISLDLTCDEQDITQKGLSEGQKEEMIGQDGGQTFSSCDKSVYSDIESTSTTESDEVHKVLKSVLTSHFSDLSNQLSRCLSRVSAAMYSKRLISESVRDCPTVYNVIGEFESGMKLASNISKLQEHCQLFLQCLSSEGGPTKLAAQKLCQDWMEKVKKQCDISLDLTCDEQDIKQEFNSLVLKYKEEIKTYRKQVSDLKEKLNAQCKISRAKTLELENLHRKESLTDKEEVPKPTKEIKRPPNIAPSLSKLEVVLQPVQDDWEQLGVSLGIDQSVLSLIKSTPGDSTYYMRCLLEKWSMKGGQLQDLEKGLISIGKKDVISGLYQMKEVPIDVKSNVQITHDSIARHLSKVEVVLQPVQDDWEQFGISLGVDQSVLSLIKSTPGDSTEYMKQLLEKLSIEGRQLQDLEKGLMSIGRKDVISGFYQMIERKEDVSTPSDVKLEEELLEETVTEPMMSLVFKKDVAVQFNSLIAINDTLRGVYIGDKKMFTIQGDYPRSFSWDEYGLRIDVPQGTLSSTDTSDISVVALVGGQFQLPEDSELISIIYAISVSKPLQQEVKLEIQHCAHLVTEDHTNYLSFITAPLDQPVLPYQFQQEDGGHFSPGDPYGSIFLSQFSLKGIAKFFRRIFRRPRRHDNTSPEETVAPNESNTTSQRISQTTKSSLTSPFTCDAHVLSLIDDNSVVISSDTDSTSIFLSTEDNTNSIGTPSQQPDSQQSTLTPSTISTKQSQTQDESLGSTSSSSPDNMYDGQVIYETKHHNRWLMQFMVAKHLNGLQEFLKTSLPANAEKDVDISFTFKDSDGFIELVLNEEEKHSFTGWSIRPHSSPILIHKMKVDMYGAQVPPSFPSLLITVSAKHGPNTVEEINHSISFKGIEPDNVKIYIIRSLSNNVTGNIGGMVSPIGNSTGPSFGPFSPEEVFRTHYSALYTQMCVSSNRLSIAPELFSARLITAQCHASAVDDSPKTDVEKSTSLMIGVMSIINTQPQLIIKLIEILKKFDAVKLIAETMQHDLSYPAHSN